MSGDLRVLLGEIKGKLDAVADCQGRMETKFDGLSNRISRVENKASKNGLITGAMAAVGVAFIKDKLGV
ncbi:MAG: hypothetical protein ACU83U_10980 [Gammaproteobacteria bacterium]